MLSLTYENAWEQSEDGLTPAEAAAAWTDMLYAFWSQEECEPVSECDDCLDQLRVNPSNGALGWDRGGIGFYEVPDGAWVDNAPVFPSANPQPGATDEDKRCQGARNASLVVAQFYYETWDTLPRLLDGAIFSFVSGMAELMKLAFGNNPGINWLTDYAVQIQSDQTFFTDPYDEEQLETLRNILYCNSSVDEAGVVSFDWDAVQDALAALLLSVYSGMKLIIFALMGEDGLNAAGNVINNDPAECGSCGDTWCYTFDFSVDDGGFGVWASQGQYEADCCWKPLAPINGRVAPQKVLPLLPAGTEVEVLLSSFPIGGTLNAIGWWYGVGAYTIDDYVTPASNPATRTLVRDATNFRIDVAVDSASPNTGLAPSVLSITFRGEGENPFGSDNC